MRCLLVGVWLLLAPLVSSSGSAQDAPQPTVLSALGAIQHACRDSEDAGPRRLYAVDVPRFSFVRYDAAAGKLEIDMRRNLRIFGGAAELFPSDLEAIAFTAGADRATELRRVASEGAKLRLGFFLSFDEPSRHACLIRPAAGVTTVRIDLAFVELLSTDGSVLARDDTDRLRSWADDAEQDGVPGRGPRGVLGSASLSGNGQLPEAWQTGIANASVGPLARDLSRCMAAAVTRGADNAADVVLRLTLDGETGQVEESEVELSSLGDDEGAACVARVVKARLRLHPSRGAGRVTLSVPVRLRGE